MTVNRLLSLTEKNPYYRLRQRLLLGGGDQKTSQVSLLGTARSYEALVGLGDYLLRAG